MPNHIVMRQSLFFSSNYQICLSFNHSLFISVFAQMYFILQCTMWHVIKNITVDICCGTFVCFNQIHGQMILWANTWFLPDAYGRINVLLYRSEIDVFRIRKTVTITSSLQQSIFTVCLFCFLSGWDDYTTTSIRFSFECWVKHSQALKISLLLIIVRLIFICTAMMSQFQPSICTTLVHY